MTSEQPSVTERPWIKASMSSNSGSCVEMRRAHGGGIDVRDSKDPDGPELHFTRAEFAAWLDGAQKGEFKNLTQD